MASAPGGLAHRCRDPPDQTALLERARDEIRKGTVQLSPRGYSHVFLHSADAGQPDTQSMRAPVEISTPAIAFQEVFDRTALRRIAEAYVLERDPTEVRESIDGDKPGGARRPRARSTGHLDRHDWQARGGDRIRYRVAPSRRRRKSPRPCPQPSSLRPPRRRRSRRWK